MVAMTPENLVYERPAAFTNNMYESKNRQT